MVDGTPSRVALACGLLASSVVMVTTTRRLIMTDSINIYVSDVFQFSVPLNGRSKVDVAEAARIAMGLAEDRQPLFSVTGIYFA